MWGLLAAIPLVASSASYLWTRIYPSDEVFPAGPRLHSLFVAVQFTIVAWLFSTWQPAPARVALALLYLGIAAGAAYLLVTRGRIPCGCISSQPNHRLSWWLVAADVLLAVAASASAREHVTFAPAWGIFLLVAASLVSLVVTTGIPDALAAIRHYSRAADQYRSLVTRNKELVP